MNLESLRRKRAKRLGVKAGAHTGQRRIFFVLDRATRKFHGDVGLWMQYIDYARKQKAHNKLSQILTNSLRLHPTKPELWIFAADYAMGTQGDMIEARSYMQRGLRFCKHSRELWLEYAKTEMMYIAKIFARRRILGLSQDRRPKNQASACDDSDADHVVLPTITAEDINPSLRTDDPIDQSALDKLSATPALSGAIPIAIYDAAMDQFLEETLGEGFFNMYAGFQDVPCLSRVLEHVADRLVSMAPKSPIALDCHIRQPLIGMKATASGFPVALSLTLDRLNCSLDKVPSIGDSKAQPYPRLSLLQRTIDWLLLYLALEGLDQDIHKVLMATLRRMAIQYQQGIRDKGGDRAEEVADYIEKFQSRGLYKLAASLISWSIHTWPSSTRLLTLKDASDSAYVNQ